MEHVVAVFFALGFPALTTPNYARRRDAILAGTPGLRSREYRETIAWLAGMGIASVVFFVWTGRDLEQLGVALPAAGLGAFSLGLAVALAAVLWIQLQAAKRDEATRLAVREALLPTREYYPTSPSERRLFRMVSFAAGIGEELFYRGFLLWYLGQWFPIWVAVVVSSALFGLAHIMHGARASVRSTGTGFVLAGLYLLGGSLLAPMILHTAIDLTSGDLGAVVFAEDRGEPA